MAEAQSVGEHLTFLVDAQRGQKSDNALGIHRGCFRSCSIDEMAYGVNGAARVLAFRSMKSMQNYQ